MKGWSKEDVALLEEDQDREYSSKLEINKSMDPDGMDPQMLRVVLADVISRPFLVIFDCL